MLYGIIRSSTRQISPKQPVIGIDEDGHKLCTVSAYSRLPKFVNLRPGHHTLRFVAARARSGSSFEKDILITENQILVVVCEPIQPRTIFKKGPEADTWWIGSA
jgi:hypothetical protein